MKRYTRKVQYYRVLCFFLEFNCVFGAISASKEPFSDGIVEPGRF